ncbi:MAG: trypsin-like peptidase domain-containing protein [Pirellulales bacterium]
MGILLTAHAPVTAQLTFIAPTDTQSAIPKSGGWVDAEVIGDSVAPDSLLLDSLAPGEVLVEHSMVHDLAARPRGSFFSAAPQQPAHPAVVRVVAADFGGASLGSGTLVDVNDEQGLVVTNWHVVRDAPGNVIVVFPDGFQSLGRVLRMDANWDLAAILINKPRVAPVRLAAEAPQIGETLTIAGYGGGSYRAVAGACTDYLAPSMQHPQELVELAASARQGDSGGPIFNARGELAGVLFGEAGGRTTGAYCGRVHSFLAAAVQELYQPDGSALAGQPERVRPSQPSANVATSISSSGGASPRVDLTTQSAMAATAEEYWQNPRAATNADPSSNGQSPVATTANNRFIDVSSSVAAPPAERAEIAEPASFYAATPARGNKTEPHTAKIGPVAAIDSPTIRAASAFSSPQSPPRNGAASEQNGPSIAKQVASAPAADAETGSLTWQFFAGDTLISQLKTVLACVGIAAVLIHGTRAFTRNTTTGMRAASKRARR